MPTVNFGGGGIMVWDYSSGVWKPLLTVKGNLNASECQDILKNALLQTLREQFGEGSLLFQHDCESQGRKKAF